MSSIALDLDGTLIDCRERQCQLAAALCRAIRLPLDVSAFWASKREGLTTRDALQDQGIAGSLAETIAQLWALAIEYDHWLRLDREFSGVTQALHQARNAGYDLHLITARRNARALFRQLAWLGWIDLFTSVQVVSPFRAAVEKAKHLRCLRPAVFIGDSETDLEAAESAQVAFSYVLTGQRSVRYWRSHPSSNYGSEFETIGEALIGIAYAK